MGRTAAHSLLGVVERPPLALGDHDRQTVRVIVDKAVRCAVAGADVLDGLAVGGVNADQRRLKRDGWRQAT